MTIALASRIKLALTSSKKAFQKMLKHPKILLKAMRTMVTRLLESLRNYDVRGTVWLFYSATNIPYFKSENGKKFIKIMRYNTTGSGKRFNRLNRMTVQLIECF